MELKIIFEPVAIKAATIKLQFIIGKFIAKNLLPKHSEMNAELMVGQVPKDRPVRQRPTMQRILEPVTIDSSVIIAAELVMTLAIIMVLRRPSLSNITPVATRPRPLQTESKPTSVVATETLKHRESAKSLAIEITVFPTAARQAMQMNAFQNVVLFSI